MHLCKKFCVTEKGIKPTRSKITKLHSPPRLFSKLRKIIQFRNANSVATTYMEKCLAGSTFLGRWLKHLVNHILFYKEACHSWNKNQNLKRSYCFFRNLKQILFRIRSSRTKIYLWKHWRPNTVPKVKWSKKRRELFRAGRFPYWQFKNKNLLLYSCDIFRPQTQLIAKKSVGYIEYANSIGEIHIGHGP
jgi:hypothetical protein